MNKATKDAIGLHWSNVQPFLAIIIMGVVIWYLWGKLDNAKLELEATKNDLAIEKKNHKATVQAQEDYFNQTEIRLNALEISKKDGLHEGKISVKSISSN